MLRDRTLFDLEEDAEEPLVTPKRRLDGELDLTSLIDVVFLLLIFFMVTSTMKGTPDIDVPDAHFGTGVTERTSTIITVRRQGLVGPPVVILGDGHGPEGNLEMVRAYVEKGLRDRRNHVIIKAERDIPHGFVQQVAKAATAIEGVRLNIGVQEKR